MSTQRTKKGCGCLVVGWALIIVAGIAWFLGGEVLSQYGNPGYVAIGFAIGVGVCCVIVGNIYVKIRNWLKSKFGRNRSTTTSTSSSAGTSNRRMPEGLPGFGNSNSQQTSQRQQQPQQQQQRPQQQQPSQQRGGFPDQGWNQQNQQNEQQGCPGIDGNPWGQPQGLSGSQQEGRGDRPGPQDGGRPPMGGPRQGNPRR